MIIKTADILEVGQLSSDLLFCRQDTPYGLPGRNGHEVDSEDRARAVNDPLQAGVPVASPG
jgi:hypothetical protein